MGGIGVYTPTDTWKRPSLRKQGLGIVTLHYATK